MPVMSSHLPNPGPSAQSFIRFRLLDGSPMSGLSPWAVEDAFVGAVGRCLSARPLRGGDLLVRCDPGERQQLLAITRVAGAEVRAWVPPHLNQSQGSIFAPSLQPLSIPELEEGFRRVGVRGVYRPPRSPKILILTFDTPQPPASVRAAYLSFPVRPIPPKPLRCRRCQRYGHRQQHCRAPHPVCSSCAQEGHDSPSCSSPSVCCAGCGDEHPSNDPGCPRWLAECQVSLLIRQGWEPRDARHYVATHPDADPTTIPSNSDSVRRPPPINHSEYPPLPQKPNYIPPRPPTPRYPSSSGRSTPNAPPPPPPRPASAARSPAVPPRPPRAAGADSHGTPAPPPPPRERPAPPASQPKDTDESQAPVRSGLSNSDSNLTDSNTTTDHSSTPSPTTPPGRPRRTRLQSAPAESHTYTLRQKH
ncbi:vegetative cell wall protein gp1-like [Amphibalanus amphitrite]|uniref:vegetative cell wall protein gp1-like n=1 Tax=Amphibalanus amphitrite TaxID=1232801 RepID=UPI001C920E8B|nr:vegetative cell wall protein gp1-like [Amphibalanus amphitrite]